MVKRGGPRKHVLFPIQAVTFRKDELSFVLSVLHHHFRNALAPFGDSARFKLDLNIQVHRRGKKEKPSKTPTP